MHINIWRCRVICEQKPCEVVYYRVPKNCYILENLSLTPDHGQGQQNAFENSRKAQPLDEKATEAQENSPTLCPSI